MQMDELSAIAANVETNLIVQPGNTVKWDAPDNEKETFQAVVMPV